MFPLSILDCSAVLVCRGLMCRLPWVVGGATQREEKRKISVWGHGVNLHPVGSGLEGGELPCRGRGSACYSDLRQGGEVINQHDFLAFTHRFV